MRLPRLIGRAEALRLLLTGDQIAAQEALRIGLINQVCDHALERACAFAEEHSAKAQLNQTIQE